MGYSEKLNGYWEEGYHYFLEFRDEKLTVRNYRREITIETKVTYDEEALEKGERTIISLEDNVLSRDYEGGMMTEIQELAYENGELKLLYYYTIMGETLYTLKKVDKGPFDHIIIRDDYLENLRGRWLVYRANEKRSENPPDVDVLSFEGNKLMFGDGVTLEMRCIEYNYAPGRLRLIQPNLIDSAFGFYDSFEIKDDTIVGYPAVSDLNSAPRVFVKEDKYDTYQPPTYNAPTFPGMDLSKGIPAGMNMMSMMNMMNQMNAVSGGSQNPAPQGSTPKFCRECGTATTPGQKFCSNCGNKLQ